MAKLTDTQLIVLSSATHRDDGAIVLPKHLKGRSAANVVKQLLAQKLVKEVQAKPEMPFWRVDQETGRSYALIITRAGSDAINVEPETPADDQRHSDDDGIGPAAAANGRRPRKRKAGPHHKESASSGPATEGACAPRTGSKLALVVKMLGRVHGVSIDDLTTATDWLPHTTRSVINSLRNKGYRIETERNRDNKTVYRIRDGEHTTSRGRAA